MAIEIELTPRKLERIVFLAIILVFMSTTIYYSYKYSQCTESQNNISGAVVSVDADIVEGSNEDSAPAESEQEAPTEEPAAEEPQQPSSLSGSVDITISPIRYEIKESSVYKKAIIDTLSFIVYNQASTDLKMKVKVYHSNAKTSEEYNNNSKVTLEFPTIASGQHQTKTFFDVPNLNFYNLELDQTLKFVFEDQDGNEIQTLTKVLKMV